jgi:hypothetical protein
MESCGEYGCTVIATATTPDNIESAFTGNMERFAKAIYLKRFI